MSYATPEGRVVKRILDWLNDQPRCTARKIHGGPHGTAGEPDIDAVLDGRAVKLEVKLPGTEVKVRRAVTSLQSARLRDYRRCGAIAAVVTSVEEVEALLGEPFDPDGPHSEREQLAVRVRARLD